MHNPANNSCPINADPRNESCDCDRPLAPVLQLVPKPKRLPGAIYDWPCIFVPDDDSSVDIGAP